jgi:hypothetical protein
MAKAYVEIDWSGEGYEPWTLDEYERFMYGTGEWDEPLAEPEAFFTHGSGCVIRKSTYETDFGDGARL